MESLAGKWRLSTWEAVWAYEVVGHSDGFLYQDPSAALLRKDVAGAVEGSTLTIRVDGGFAQSGLIGLVIATIIVGAQFALVLKYAGASLDVKPRAGHR